MVAFFIFQRVSQKCFSKTVRSIDLKKFVIIPLFTKILENKE